MNVLITGASGFIGRHLINILDNDKKDYEIHATYHQKKPNKELSKVKWHKSDLFKDSEVEALIKKIQPTHIIHLAWYTEHGKFWNSEKNKDWMNASIKLFKIFKKYSGKRFIYSGSKAEYFDGEFMEEHFNSSFECNESDKPNPDTVYGEYKNLLHNELNKLDNKDKKSLVWARIFDTYGPYENDKKFCSYVINNSINKKQIIINNPFLAMDFLHVHDIANAFKLILEKDFLGTVNISSGKTISLKYIAEYITKKFNTENLLKLNHESKDLRQIFGNNNTLKSLGWNNSYKIQDGLDDLIKFYVEEYE